HRSRLSVLSLLCLTSLGLPGPAGAEEGFPPLRPAGAPPIEARALEPPQGETSFASAAESALQSQAPDPTQPGLDANRYSSDERLDPEKSTVAAASYLRDLHAMFGSWELAKAAYNAGEMKVIRAMKALKTRDFWDLTRGSVLREETKNFVPAIQAATLIGREPERYGFVAAFAEPLAYEQAPVPAVTTLKHVAALAGVSADELEELN